jgi:ketosteroid isomerase-like protein
MSVNNPIGTVKQMYAAFVEGDLDKLVETIHPALLWIYYGANSRLSKAEFKGRMAVRKFFEKILERLIINSFNTNEFILQDDTVVVFGKPVLLAIQKIHELKLNLNCPVPITIALYY